MLSNYINGSPADVDALAAMLAKGELNGVHFRTDEIDATFEKVHAAGAEIVQEPTDQPWGACGRLRSAPLAGYCGNRGPWRPLSQFELPVAKFLFKSGPISAICSEKALSRNNLLSQLRHRSPRPNLPLGREPVRGYKKSSTPF